MADPKTCDPSPTEKGNVQNERPDPNGTVDLHSNNSVFSIKDEPGVVIARRKLANDIKQICLFLAPFKP
jgi:hypothetical protein